jgi:hypothetical protein
MREQDIEAIKKEGYMWLNCREGCMYLFYEKSYEIEYICICVLKEPLRLVLRRRFIRRMNLTFSKIVVLLVNEYRISERREKKFLEIKDNVLYVNQAVNVMHFIRNKLSPLSNLVTYYKKYDEIPQETRVNMEPYLKKEAYQADRALSEITLFAEYLLKKSRSSSIGNTKVEISLYKLYLILSEIVEAYFGVTVVADSTIQDGAKNNIVVNTNLIESKILLYDWVNNMHKYSCGSEEFSMMVRDKFLIIHFENKYSEEEEASRLVANLNSQENDAVLQRKDSGMGLQNIKSIAKDLGIEIYAMKDSKTHIISLEFKFVTYERKQDLNI